MELAAGMILEDRYKVLSEIKSGGMGAVFRVEDTRLEGTIYALKLMHEPPAEWGHGPLFERRFREEMRVLSALRHPQIPRIMDFFSYGQSYGIVMDYIDGENLESMLETKPLPVDFVLDVAEQVLDVLQYLHSHEPPIVHRDIKPANLILNRANGRIILVDFGLARRIPEGLPTQTVVGTLGYSPLEQMQGRGEIRSDLYALGATMHHLLTGTTPQAFAPAPLATVLPGVREDLAMLVDRAVQMRPEDRFPHAQAMLEAVRALRHPLPPLPGPVPPPAVPASTPGVMETEHILVVDDDPIVGTFLRRVLEREHYRVTVVPSGEEALELALRCCPDVILSDVQMPGLSGLALCRKLRNHRSTRDIPVVLLTGQTNVSDEAMGLEAGAEDYIGKPIVPERLVARIQVVLRRRVTRPS